MRSYAILFMLLILPFISEGQELVRGIVVDSATFDGIPSVNVQVKGKFIGSTTDDRGNFSIRALPSDTLVFSRVGYERTELTLSDYETGMIRMTEKQTLLAPITVEESSIYLNRYEGLFDTQQEALRKKIPFYYSRARKDRIKAASWREESMRVQTYVNVVINNPKTKEGLMEKHKLTEKEYYEILTQFNETHYQVMYFLTEPELVSLLGKFFEFKAPYR